MKRLKGKTAFITGAAQGIGLSIATLFTEEGARVLMSDLDRCKLEKAAAAIGKSAVAYHHDVSKESDWERVHQAIASTHGTLDILINNAGITGVSEHLQNPEDIELDAYKKIFDVNVKSVMLGCKMAVKLMKEKGGSIVNLSSRSALVGVPHLAAYAASKAAVHNYTKSVALYAAEQGYQIRCNSLHPAAILTPMWEEILEQKGHKDEAIARLERAIPLGHMGKAIDVAYAALYFASNESAFTTGTELIIDGGILAGCGAAPGKS